MFILHSAAFFFIWRLYQDFSLHFNERKVQLNAQLNKIQWDVDRIQLFARWYYCCCCCCCCCMNDVHWTWYYIDGTKINTLWSGSPYHTCVKSIFYILRLSLSHFRSLHSIWNVCIAFSAYTLARPYYAQAHPSIYAWSLPKILCRIQIDPRALWHTCVHWNFVDWLVSIRRFCQWCWCFQCCHLFENQYLLQR